MSITDEQAKIIGIEIGRAIAEALTDRRHLSLSSRFMETVKTGFDAMAKAIEKTGKRP
jgi:hypothetical protein